MTNSDDMDDSYDIDDMDMPTAVTTLRHGTAPSRSGLVRNQEAQVTEPTVAFLA